MLGRHRPGAGEGAEPARTATRALLTRVGETSPRPAMGWPLWAPGVAVARYAGLPDSRAWAPSSSDSEATPDETAWRNAGPAMRSSRPGEVAVTVAVLGMP